MIRVSGGCVRPVGPVVGRCRLKTFIPAADHNPEGR